MRIRSFIVAYALVLAILLFADRRPAAPQQNLHSRVVDLTDGQNANPLNAPAASSKTRIIAPGASFQEPGPPGRSRPSVSWPLWWSWI